MIKRDGNKSWGLSANVHWNHMDTKRAVLSGGELRDYPGHWKITLRLDGEEGEWSVVRKPDGTYWEVAGIHIFPSSGETLRIDIGAQILDQKKLGECETRYIQLQEKLAERTAK